MITRVCMSPQNLMAKLWGDDLADRQLLCKHEGPNVASQQPHKIPGMLACVCNPSLGRQTQVEPWTFLASRIRKPRVSESLSQKIR